MTRTEWAGAPMRHAQARRAQPVAAAAPRDDVFGWRVEGKYKNLPTKGEVRGIAGRVAFLAGPDGRYVTGASLAVDGGYEA